MGLHIFTKLQDLTFTPPWAYSADDKLKIFFSFFPENRIWHFMQFVWNVKSCFLGKNNKNNSTCRLLKIYPYRVLSDKVWCFPNSAQHIRRKRTRKGSLPCLWAKIVQNSPPPFRAVWSVLSLPAQKAKGYCKIHRRAKKTDVHVNSGP